MSEVCYIRCPECDEKFKSSTDKEGTKVRCPECDEPFRVTAKMISKPKGAKDFGIQKGASPRPRGDAPAPAGDFTLSADGTQPAPPPEANGDSDVDEDGNPYKVVEVKVAARCPSCAKELLSEKDIICVHCGYNLLTREVGATKRTIEMTAQDQLIHLGPALGALGFAIFLLLALLYYCLIFPRQVADSWLDFNDSEPMRLFAIVISCFLLFWAGSYSMGQFIFSPKPKEREKD
jgi:DNA-directed RNA polymerase subunit RPC12/RpoP